MNPHSSAPHIAEALIRATQHWHKQPPPAAPQGTAPPAFTIAVSREVGARGTSVAREVGRRLNWTVYDHELLEHIAREMNLRVRLLESVDERRMSWLQECLEALASGPLVTESVYVRHLVQTLLPLAAHGECVVVGRGAAMILPADTTLRVRLIASPEDRADVMSRELGVSQEEARRRIEKSDRERIRFVKDHFQKDPTDNQNYDLVLNASRFTISECADLVVEALHRLQSRAGKPAAAV